MKKILKIEILQALDYLEYEDWVIIAYFSKKNEEIQNNLLILDTNAQILLHTTLNKNTEGIGLETFLIIDQKLLVIEEKTRLIAYQLKK